MSYWNKALSDSIGRLRRSAESNCPEKSSPTFTLFPKLPTELRLKIWKYALPGPRAIRVQRNWPTMSGPIRAVAKPPAVLQTNSESRQLAMRFYELSFNSAIKGRPINIDYQVDALYMESWGVFNAFYRVARQFPNCDAAGEIRDMESRLRCLVLGDIKWYDQLDPDRMLTLRNIEGLILHFKIPYYGTQILTEEEAEGFRRVARATRTFAREVNTVWKMNLRKDERIPKIRYVNDNGGAIKVQTWEVRALILLNRYLADHGFGKGFEG
jgi:hypothetical protein